MKPSLPSLLLLCISRALADPTDYSITTPTRVEAGTPFNATINVKWYGVADSSYAYAFRIYLATSYKDQRSSWYDPECYLINAQTLCARTITISSDNILFNNTPITLTIPSSVGPSGKHYAIIGRIINTDGSYYGATWESDIIDLIGANGTWAEYQKQGYHVWGDDGTACSGFNCVKECADRYWLQGVMSSRNETYNGCANACPGVNINFGNSTRGGQPTAARTTPTACSQGSTTTSTTSRFSGSSIRSATAVAATGNAVPHVYPSNGFLRILALLAGTSMLF